MFSGFYFFSVKLNAEVKHLTVLQSNYVVYSNSNMKNFHKLLRHSGIIMSYIAVPHVHKVYKKKYFAPNIHYVYNLCYI